MTVKRIAVTPDITRDNVRILQMLFYQFERMQIILCRIVRVDHQFYAVLIYQVFIFFLHETYNNVNFLNTYFVKLLDDSFNQRLPIDFQKSLGHLGIDGDHPHPKAGCQNNGTFGSFILVLRHSLCRRTNRFVQIPCLNEFLEGTIYYSQGMTRNLR